MGIRCILVGYSTQSRDIMTTTRETRLIVESIHSDLMVQRDVEDEAMADSALDRSNAGRTSSVDSHKSGISRCQTFWQERRGVLISKNHLLQLLAWKLSGFLLAFDAQMSFLNLSDGT
ncbi:hypothetical protein Tco_0783178 [Tanacetum coccineum]